MGDLVGISVDLKQKIMGFFLNGQNLQFIQISSKSNVQPDEQWFPAMGLSHGTKVTLTPRVRPYVDFPIHVMTPSTDDTSNSENLDGGW